MTETNPDRPLVTFMLIAYNQERFIREAVEGAFSQTYSPLEIILSHDCSKDRTFEIMKEMAAGYHGPHTVIVRRNETNQGIAGHINKIMEVASGEIVVAAAGDDISLPERTNTIVEAYIQSEGKALSLFSDIIDINEIGQPIFRRKSGKKPSFGILEMASRQVSVSGNSHAWHRKLFDLFGPINPIAIQEDVVIPFRACLIGEVKYLSNQLVLRRSHSGNTWNHPRGISMAEEVSWQVQKYSKWIDNLIGIYQTKSNDLETMKGWQSENAIDIVVLKRIVEKRLQEAFMERTYYESHLLKRLWIMVRAAWLRVPSRKVIRWLIQYGSPRTYYSLRRLEQCFRRTYLSCD
jgi:glycosyltransferase involved in cell wall biosynthesis